MPSPHDLCPGWLTYLLLHSNLIVFNQSKLKKSKSKVSGRKRNRGHWQRLGDRMSVFISLFSMCVAVLFHFDYVQMHSIAVADLFLEMPTDSLSYFLFVCLW